MPSSAWLKPFLELVRIHLAARPPQLRRIDAARAAAQGRPAFILPARRRPRLRLCPRNPELRLIVYGTLAPGGLFHHLLADIPGDWRPCTIRGRMGLIRHYRAFRWNPAGEDHAAWLFTSSHLPGKLAHLDRFEGRAYRRRLIPAEVAGCLVVGFVYEARTQA
jgi:gamma-glutamylcyclotransferase (GGCT)/AIG2-like uncharacterized protein YtfP